MAEKTAESDEFDILSSIWIMACNDENPLMTYEGLKNRMPSVALERIQELVKQRVELFRQGVSDERLNAWKMEMVATPRKRPRYIREASNYEAEQVRAINAIQSEHVFRSQFRTRNGAGKSSIEIVDWGLKHLERLRTAKVEANEVKKKWWVSVATLIVAVIGIIVQLLIAYSKSRSSTEKGLHFWFNL